MILCPDCGEIAPEEFEYGHCPLCSIYDEENGDHDILCMCVECLG